MKLFEQLRRIDREILLGLLMLLFFSVGLLGHLLDWTRPLMLRLSPYFLFIFGSVALWPIVQEQKQAFWIWAGATLLLTFALEALGTATGWIFGPYSYGSTLGFKLFNVPLVIAFNWLIVILAALRLALRISRNPWLVALIAGGLAVCFDLVMEPVAVGLDYWTWHTAGIPLQNYLAWFGIAFAAALAFVLLRFDLQSRLALYYVAIQFLFFLVLALKGVHA